MSAATDAGALDVAALLDHAAERGFDLDWFDVARIGGFREGVGVSRDAADFIAAYALLRQPTAVLDPWATEMSILGAVAERTQPHRALGLLPCEVPKELRDLTQLRNLWIDWRAEDALTFLEQTDELFDLVVSAPPWHSERQRTHVVVGDRRVDVHDDLVGQLVARVGRVLSADGQAVFIVSERFLTDRRPKSAYAQLEATGLHLRAAIALPPNAGTALAGYLAVLACQPAGQLFVGEWRSSASSEQLLTNLAETRADPDELSLGALIARDSFYGWRQFSGQNRLDRLLEEHAAERVRLGDMATIGRFYIEADDPLPMTPNAVYLISPGRRPASTRPDPPDKGRREYLQLLLSEDHAVAEYIAMLLNTPVGEALRDATLVGAGIQRVSPDRLAEVRVPLPPPEVQQAIVSAERRLVSMQQDIERLRSRLLLDPEALDDVADVAQPRAQSSRRVAPTERPAQDDEPTLREWMDTLPFPLASTLLRFAKTRRTGDKIDSARHFFEATAMFFALVLVSAFRRCDELFEEEKVRWTEKPTAPVHRFEHADIGGWGALGRNLSAASRQLRENKDPCANIIFEGLTPRLIEALTTKKFWNTLDHARQIRNSRYHGGAEDERYRQALLNELEQDLTAARSILGASLEDVRLVRPGPSGRRGGTRHYREADVLRGPDVQFDPGSFTSILDLDEDRLYLLPADGPSDSALEIPPLIRLGPPPKGAANACYFYNRIEGTGKVRFVSYHFEDEPERFEPPDSELGAWIAAINFPSRRPS